MKITYHPLAYLPKVRIQYFTGVLDNESTEKKNVEEITIKRKFFCSTNNIVRLESKQFDNLVSKLFDRVAASANAFNSNHNLLPSSKLNHYIYGTISVILRCCKIMQRGIDFTFCNIGKVFPASFNSVASG